MKLLCIQKNIIVVWCVSDSSRSSPAAQWVRIADGSQMEDFIHSRWRRGELPAVCRGESERKRWGLCSWEFNIKVELNWPGNYIYFIFYTTEKLVLQHVKRFRIDAKCQWPSRRVIDAPSPAYTPRKYLVFKCSDDTACCHSHEETCVAKNSKSVDLWFRVDQVGQSSGNKSVRKFFNLIQACECGSIARAKTTRMPCSILS